MANHALTGILLVGGASTRFGSEKALARVGGRTLAEIAWDTLTFCEERIALGGPPRARVIRSGETIAFDSAHVHRMRHAGGEPAVSIHVYSPPLGRMGVYSVEADGTLRRETVPYDEELRAEGAGAVAAAL